MVQSILLRKYPVTGEDVTDVFFCVFMVLKLVYKR